MPPDLIFDLSLHDFRYEGVTVVHRVPMPIPPEQFVGRKVADLFSAGLVNQLADAAQLALAGEPVTMRYPIKHGPRVLMTEARISVPPGSQILRVEAARLDGSRD